MSAILSDCVCVCLGFCVLKYFSYYVMDFILLPFIALLVK